ncbi:MAG: hypothetical protein JXO22_13275 [Phycisphaerae bacterium]|nr:hypothetical protein [Phycisphaerae bacterium]
MSELLFERLKWIRAVGQVERGGRDIKPFQIVKVLHQQPREVAFVGCDIGRVGGRVAVHAPMGAAGVHVDAVAMPAWEVVLMRERAVPLDHAGARWLQNLLA